MKGNIQSQTAPSVTNAAASISAGNRTGVRYIKNTSASTIYIGGADLTAANGYPLAPGETFIDKYISGQVFAISPSGTVTINILEIG